ncbi:alanine racemase [Kosmotoga arenicorallina S304]|uniref:Alanine racemase n=1 Tax=Kosmotoga arenicorallina S304 TaxID=1453497 RepID=A0A176K2G1_9BACT|nr:alanine racemase [Kosmotoga arenicorallina]OAA31202.1 alanine racemase [Kosmotoga arenicorallina S304]
MLSRETFLEIDLSAYQHNIRFFTKKLFPTKVMAVVKSNAYGHGAVEISQAAIEAGVDMLAVAFLEEAIELRSEGINVPILIFNYFNPRYASEALKNNLTITIYSKQQLNEIIRYVPHGLKVHLNLDTGMRRLGPSVEEAYELAENILKAGYELEGVYTHFAVADETEERFTIAQITKYRHFIEKLKKAGVNIKMLHVANSAGSLRFNYPVFNYARIGVASYGLQPSEEFLIDDLIPVLSWKSAISYVKKIKKGDSISYGRTFIAPRDMIVATVPVGYGDGYSRGLSNKGEVLISGKRCKIVGRVCMDQFVVDVSNLKQKPKMGDEVVLIGKQGEDHITTEEIARLLDTINYEITCAITSRVPRIYLRRENSP